MNRSQELWWRQAESDYSIFLLLRGEGVAMSHSLHYLQMATEKLAKAYFWRSGAAPVQSHAAFVAFLRMLIVQVRQKDRRRIAGLFSFTRFQDFRNTIRSILPLAYQLERLSPDLASDGPNPEYPWPHEQPTIAPFDHDFPIWSELMFGQGHELMRIIHAAIQHFPEFADC